MSTGCKINAEELVKKFQDIEYGRLNDAFRGAIQNSINILKNATISELQKTGVNINSPIKAWGRTYNPLVKGVIAEVSADATSGRVRVAAASKKNYGYGENGSFALKWFENGTEERFKKGQGYSSMKTKSGNSSRKHRNKGASTGRLKAYGFFNTAYEMTKDMVNKSLEENINNAINSIWNR